MRPAGREQANVGLFERTPGLRVPRPAGRTLAMLRTRAARHGPDAAVAWMRGHGLWHRSLDRLDADTVTAVMLAPLDADDMALMESASSRMRLDMGLRRLYAASQGRRPKTDERALREAVARAAAANTGKGCACLDYDIWLELGTMAARLIAG